MDDAVLDWMPMAGVATDESLVNRLFVELRTLRQELAEVRREVVVLRAENAQLRQQVGYYKSMHERAVARLAEKDADIERLKGRVRQLESERFGKQSEKAAASERVPAAAARRRWWRPRLPS